MFARSMFNRFRRGAPRAGAAPASIAWLALGMLFADAAGVGQARAALPLPPRRPPEFSAPVGPAPTSPAPQSTPQTPDATAPPGQRLPVDIPPDDMKPFNLPPASRQRMRLCGERWRDLKMAGASRGLTWRSFAEKCLPGKD
jgi:hypothetical protein